MFLDLRLPRFDQIFLHHLGFTHEFGSLNTGSKNGKLNESLNVIFASATSDSAIVLINTSFLHCGFLFDILLCVWNSPLGQVNQRSCQNQPSWTPRCCKSELICIGSRLIAEKKAEIL